jgi:hypothetical protein
MPFSKTKSHTSEEWTEIFENVHSLAIIESRLGYDCQRSNIRPGAFIKDILTMLNQADVVLADLTDMNPNVFYELGVRHTLKNRTILVSQSLDEVPSDLRQYGNIKYDMTPKGVVEYKKKINSILRDIRDNPDRSDNPVSDYLHSKSIVTDTFEAKSIEKKLLALVSECSFNLKVIDDAIEGTLGQEKLFTYVRFQCAALETLISTYYIYPDNNYIEFAQQLFQVMTIENNRLELMKEEIYRGGIKKHISKMIPDLRKVLIEFMKRTSKVLKDFRNQNFIEPSELGIYLTKEEHKTYLD